jgi:hypothetical protein
MTNNTTKFQTTELDSLKQSMKFPVAIGTIIARMLENDEIPTILIKAPSFKSIFCRKGREKTPVHLTNDLIQNFPVIART